MIVAATLTLLPLIYFFPAVRGSIALAIGDSWSYSILVRMFLGKMLAQEVIPLWNPHVFSGMPFLASVQPGVMYPPNWIFAILPPGVALNLVVITAYHISLTGVYLYLRAMRVTVMASLIASIAFTFGGFMIAHLEQVNYVAAAAWLPWILLAIEKLYRSSSWNQLWKWVTAGAIFIALHVFAGLPQATFQILLVSGPYLLFLLLSRDDGAWNWRGRWRFLSASVLMAIFGALLSAIQLLPTRELQLQGDRAAIPYESFAMFSMPPRRLLSFIAPYFFGGALPSFYKVGGWDYWWLHKYVHGYVGLLTLLLMLMALFLAKPRRVVYFWTIVAGVSLFLAFGDELPWGINHFLYHIPVYNMFRGPYRHTYEFTFAIAVLAGLGMDTLARNENGKRPRALVWSSVIVAGLVVVTLIFYCFFARNLASLSAPPEGGTSLANSEILVPIGLLVTSFGALWLYASRRRTYAAILVLMTLVLDLALFGWFTYWRSTGHEVVERLKDPPAAQAIKEREHDLHSFRIVTYASNPYDRNYEDLSHANLAIARNLQSVTGYDPMRLSRLGLMAGDMDIFGVITDPSVFSAQDQSFNLLNVKYLLRERKSLSDSQGSQVLKIDEVRFSRNMAEIKLEQGKRAEFSGEGHAATELAIVSTMANSSQISDGEAVIGIRLRTRDGRVIEREVQAGRDTAEWAYDRADVKAVIKHRRAKIAESWPAEGFEAHRYLARIAFERAEIELVEMDYLGVGGNIVITAASLYDRVTGQSMPLEPSVLASERWRKVGSFGEVELYENLKALPRAWFVKRIEVLPSAELLRVIKEGRLPDGSTYDPAEVALLEKESFDEQKPYLLPAGTETKPEAKVTGYEPHHIEIQTNNSQAGFLVLSEVYYRGWEATVDGTEVPVERVNYTLRGIPIPAGKHRVGFVFRSPSFRAGAACSAVGALILLLGLAITQLKLSRRVEGKAYHS